MANLNKVMLIGNLTRDPQLTYTPSQTPVVDFGMAINRKWTGQDGNAREETCFVDCRSFGRQAETINKYLSKGRPVFVEGRLTYDSWTAQDGSKKSRLRVTVESFQFLSSPGEGSRGGYGEQSSQAAPPARPASSAPPTSNTGGDSGGMPHDEIPF
jgi:single-strand DNA-binding protein